MNGEPTYRIRTLADICAIPADRREAFVADLVEWLRVREALAEAVSTMVGEQLPPSVEFIWKDDGIVGPSGIRFEMQKDAP